MTVLVLAGCGGGFSLRSPPAEPVVPVSVTVAPDEDVLRPAPRPSGASASAPTMRPQGRTADALDRSTPAERAAAAAPVQQAGSTALGETLAGLGAPTEPGFWLHTGLVDRVRQGRVETAGGASVRVELRPSGNAPGSGSQISLPAMRALGVSLTQLVPLSVYALD